MTIIEHMKNIFAPASKLPQGFVRNPDFDVVLLCDIFDRAPSVIRARNGRSYVYFEDTDSAKIDIVRKMGFRPHLHKSHRYMPAKVICRAPVYRDMPTSALNVVNCLLRSRADNMYTLSQEMEKYKSSKEYAEYIANYNLSNSQQNTK